MFVRVCAGHVGGDRPRQGRTGLERGWRTKVSLLRVAAPSDVTSPVARINNSYEAKMARVCNMHVNQTEQKARWSQELSLSIARVKEQRYSFC